MRKPLLTAIALSSALLFTTVGEETTASAATVTYKVKSGDTLSKIGSKYHISYKTIMKLNHMKSTKIYVGQKLKVKKTKAKKKATKKVSKSVAGVSTSSNGSKALAIALKQQGIKYVFGGSSKSGFDCSGLIYYAYKKAGYSVSRTNAQGFYARSSATKSPRIGDLVFFKNTYKTGISHIGIYMGNSKFVSASGTKVQVSSVNESYWKKHFAGYRHL
ncbi:C40 family peptidase [Rummeliibacillus stabekisii]|uniref:Uncharacterized protein n=1 Tax=Rummeliibacillus stabekisii TaxID=241244 RepID=A0A143H9W1_9BACL|nr:LysM peptidoglycan-binding domain-containing C40 family peptidase [Rummeliibacillus stabekisii]AMW98101.1 hypothetical protein ATY39_00910 [Rummeliibacillus stabekisii]